MSSQDSSASQTSDVTDSHFRHPLAADDEDSQSDSEENENLEGYLEKRGFDGQWHRYWFSLRDSCLNCYTSSDDNAPIDVTDLSGYDVVQLIDKFKGKRFVLSLSHPNCVNVLLSLDSRDDLADWSFAIKSTIRKHGGPMANTLSAQDATADSTQASSPVSASSAASSAAQSVRHKLLAEMLRQKVELEKMQAARNGTKTRPLSDSLAADQRSSSPAKDEERVCTLTRLRQRRMSTQIKLQALQRQMEMTTFSPREKKNVFQLGKKRPDLVQGHQDVDELEEQVRRLSNLLSDLDTRITTHESVDESRFRSYSTAAQPLGLHSSYDSSSKPFTLPASLRLNGKAGLSESFDTESCDNSPKIKHKKKDKEAEKDSQKSTSLKSSVQKLAHRTFARANWSWSKKAATHNSNSLYGNDNSDSREGTSTSVFPSSSSTSQLSEMTPDVIDMTKFGRSKSSDNGENFDANHSKASSSLPNGKIHFSLEESELPEPPDAFKTHKSDHYTFLSSTLPNRGSNSLAVSRKTPRDGIRPKLTPVSSMSEIDRFSSRFSSSNSTPDLAELKSKLTLNFSPAGLSKSERGNASSPPEESGSNAKGLSRTQNADDSWISKDRRSYSSRTVSWHPPSGGAGDSVDGPERTKVSPISAPSTPRGQNYSFSQSPRREVNPTALAEIEAFEELSLKFLRSSVK